MQYMFDLNDAQTFQQTNAAMLYNFFIKQTGNYWIKNIPYTFQDSTVTLSHDVVRRCSKKTDPHKRKNQEASPSDHETARYEIIDNTLLHSSRMSKIHEILGNFSLHKNTTYFKRATPTKSRLAKFCIFSKEVSAEHIYNEYIQTQHNQSLSIKKPIVLEEKAILVMRKLHGYTADYFFHLPPCYLLLAPDFHLDNVFDTLKSIPDNAHVIIANTHDDLYYVDPHTETITHIEKTNNNSNSFFEVLSTCSLQLTAADPIISNHCEILTEKNFALSAEDRLSLFYAMLLALKTQITDNKLIHRDIKPNNIIIKKTHTLTEATIHKIFIPTWIDYGFATKNPKDQRRVGTLAFVAPEIMIPPHEGSDKTDIFSMGRMGALLWNAQRKTSARDEHFYELPSLLEDLFSNITGYSPYIRGKIKKLLGNMCAFNPLQRFSIQECIQSTEKIIFAVAAEKLSPYYTPLCDWLEISWQELERIHKTLKKNINCRKEEQNYSDYKKIQRYCELQLENITLYNTHALIPQWEQLFTNCHNHIEDYLSNTQNIRSLFILSAVFDLEEMINALETYCTRLFSYSESALQEHKHLLPKHFLLAYREERKERERENCCYIL